MELGVLVKSCPCLATELSNVFGAYWTLTQPNAKANAQFRENQQKAMFNSENPLVIQIKGSPASVYLAVSRII